MASLNQKIDHICSHLAQKLIIDVVGSLDDQRLENFLDQNRQEEIPLDVSEFFYDAGGGRILEISKKPPPPAVVEENRRNLKLCSVILLKLENDEKIRRKFAHLFEDGEEKRIITMKKAGVKLTLQSCCKPCSVRLVRLFDLNIAAAAETPTPKSPDFKLKDNFLALFHLKSKNSTKSPDKMLLNRGKINKNSKLFKSKSKKWRSIRRYLLKKEKFRRILRSKLVKTPDFDEKNYCFRCGKCDSSVQSPIFLQNQGSTLQRYQKSTLHHHDKSTLHREKTTLHQNQEKSEDQNLLLCRPCRQPYDQWYMEPWRFANYVCKFNFGIDCGCQICHFWSCVDFVRMHLALNFPDQNDYLNYVENECDLRFSDLQNFERENVNHALSSSPKQQRDQNNLFDILSTPPTCSSSIGREKFAREKMDESTSSISFYNENDDYAADNRSIIFGGGGGETEGPAPPRGVRYVSRKSCLVYNNNKNSGVNNVVNNYKNGGVNKNMQIFRLSALPDLKKKKITRKYLSKLARDENEFGGDNETVAESEFRHCVKNDQQRWRVADKNRVAETTTTPFVNNLKITIKKAGKAPSSKPKRTRQFRCRQCEGCLKTNCGNCFACKDMKVFNGPGILKQCCRQRICLRLLEKRRQVKEMKKKDKAQKRRLSL